MKTDDWGDVFIPELMAESEFVQRADAAFTAPPGTANLLGGGWVRFLNLNGVELNMFFVVPENGPPGYNPVNGPSLNVDGFWYRYIPTHWYKIPDGALVWVYKDAQGYLQLLVRTYIPLHYPEWVLPIGGNRPTVPYPW
ncbi:hypothetical protein ACFWYW_52740 [Nonomuraea sp. NPDC059023]|uniref:hypothetical protein n=1 Tax=unclassified Nonomuraea TaxID=2593643 RepID=UPI00368A076D